MYGNNKTSKNIIPSLQSVKLLEQVCERIAYKHYSLRTEQAYVYWVRWFIRWSGLHHPRDVGAADVERFLFSQRSTNISVQPTNRRCLVSLSRGGGYRVAMDE